MSHDLADIKKLRFPFVEPFVSEPIRPRPTFRVRIHTPGYSYVKNYLKLYR
jgi:hypothetical protein